MKIVASSDPSVVELRSEVDVATSLVAAVFLAAALALAVVTLGRVPVVVPPELSGPLAVAAAVCVVIGTVAVGARRGLSVDRRSRTLVSWWGLFAPWHRRSRSLAGVTRVTLAREVVRSGKKRRVVYPVALAGDERTAVAQPRDYHAARRLAERLALALHLEMVDSSTGAEVVRPPDQLDLSVRERLRRDGARLELPPPPPGLRAAIRVETDAVAAEIPSPGPALAAVARLVVGAAVAALVLVGFGTSLAQWALARDARLGWVAIAVVAGSLLALVVDRLRRVRFTTAVSATRDELRVRGCGRPVVIPVAELEELTVAGKDLASLFERRPDGSLALAPAALERPEVAERVARGGAAPAIPAALAGVVGALAALSPESAAITARSDRATATFGAGLPRAELDYLCAAIARVVAG